VTQIDTDYARVADYWRTTSYGSTTWKFDAVVKPTDLS
jgi:hypothetical protein